MIVKCAICGHSQIVTIWQDWYRSSDSMPGVWICDVHRGDFYPKV